LRFILEKKVKGADKTMVRKSWLGWEMSLRLAQNPTDPANDQCEADNKWGDEFHGDGLREVAAQVSAHMRNRLW
jgi:hypothetical protein